MESKYNSIFPLLAILTFIERTKCLLHLKRIRKSLVVPLLLRCLKDIKGLWKEVEERLVLMVRQEGRSENRTKFNLKSYVELFLLISNLDESIHVLLVLHE